MLKNKQNRAMFASFGIILIVAELIGLLTNAKSNVLMAPLVSVGLCSVVFTIFWYIRAAIISIKYKRRNK